MIDMTAVQAVFFDMGGTIETFWHTPQLRLQATPGLQELLQSAGIDLHLSNEQLYKVITAGRDRYQRWSLKTMEELPAAQVWCEFIFKGYSVDPARLAAAAENLMFYIETHYYHREMRPEMPEVLEAIRQMGLKIGLISNVCSRDQVPYSLEQYGIRHYFDPLVLSSEYGRRKPDPAIFHHAARLANVPTSECIYVGDRISRDILGARRAGYRLAIQIQHDFNQGEVDKGAHPDATIDQMTRLLDILRLQNDRSAGESLPEGDRPRLIRALFFDAGDILYYRPRRGRRLRAFLKELSLDPKADHDIEKRSLIDQAFQGQITQEQYWESVLRLYGVTQPEQIERGKRILEQEDHDIEFFEGIPKTLAALKARGFWLGIITDTANPLHVKLRWFERGGFGDVWDSIVSSKDLGVRKPDPKIYYAALQQLSLRADQAVFVGHKISELKGAKSVGMQTVAFNYEPMAEADYYVENFSDLLKLPFVACQ
jgi:putative hydrolase of the HAD superfamily